MADDRVSIVSAATIDGLTFYRLPQEGAENATAALAPARYRVISGNRCRRIWRSAAAKGAHAVIKGDARCLNIAAASVLAKVTRDRLLVYGRAMARQYGFAQHKGYQRQRALQLI